MSHNNELPSLSIVGSASIASGFPRTITQNSFVFGDDLSFVRGAHTVRFGGSVTRLQENVNLVGLGSFLSGEVEAFWDRRGTNRWAFKPEFG